MECNRYREARGAGLVRSAKRKESRTGGGWTARRGGGGEMSEERDHITLGCDTRCGLIAIAIAIAIAITNPKFASSLGLCL